MSKCNVLHFLLIDQFLYTEKSPIKYVAYQTKEPQLSLIQVNTENPARDKYKYFIHTS
jgi:hypothetical protein